MKITFFLFLYGCAALAVFAQQPAPTPVLYSAKTIAELDKLQRSALESNYAYRRLAHLTNNIGPRLTGSSQAAKAVEYVADEMRRSALEVRMQKLTVQKWVRGIETGEIV